MKIRTTLTPERFEALIFGGWCIAKHSPEIFTTGVEVVKHRGGSGVELYYQVRPDGRPWDNVHSFEASTCFFTEEEMEHFEVVE